MWLKFRPVVWPNVKQSHVSYRGPSSHRIALYTTLLWEVMIIEIFIIPYWPLHTSTTPTMRTTLLTNKTRENKHNTFRGSVLALFILRPVQIKHLELNKNIFCFHLFFTTWSCLFRFFDTISYFKFSGYGLVVNIHEWAITLWPHNEKNND